MSRSKANEYQCELTKNGVTYYVMVDFELKNPATNEHSMDVYEVQDELENDVDPEEFENKLTDNEWEQLYRQCREQSR